jgi:hypothetical protein
MPQQTQGNLALAHPVHQDENTAPEPTDQAPFRFQIPIRRVVRKRDLSGFPKEIRWMVEDD